MSSNSSRPTDDEIEYVINNYTDMLYRICLTMVKSPSDAEDAVQDVIVKYIEKYPKFSDGEHQKAWLIRVAVNRCKNMLRFSAMHPKTDLTELDNKFVEQADCELLHLLMELPIKYKSVMYLYYVEAYKVKELALIVQISEAAVKKRLQKGRAMLKSEYFEADHTKKSYGKGMHI